MGMPWKLAALLIAFSGTASARLHGDSSSSGRRLDGTRTTQEIMAELDSLVGLTEVKAQMRELTAQVEFKKERQRLGLPSIGEQSLHMSFLGNPGTGKTVVARIVGELMVAMGAIESSREGSLVTEVSRADLVGQHLGETAMQVAEVFEKAKGGVLFLDEAYALVNPSTEDMYGHEAVDTLIKLMEDHRDKVVVILAGYQAEMVEFIAANPGFRSRIAFEFNFRDYTCPELVQIGETLMKSKNVALLPDKSIGVCASGQAKEVCDWMAASIRFRTGCCDTEDCGREENRANGNGRTVRNMLEASYREMGSRVLTTYPPLLLTEYDTKVKPKVGSDGVPDPELNCEKFLQIRHNGPFTHLNETGDADLRCAFRLLEAGDLLQSTALALSEQLQANCQRTRTPITVNVSSIFTEPGAVDRLDWSKLHDLIFGEHACSKAQAVLSGDTSVARFLLEGGGDWGWGSPGGHCDVAVQCEMCRTVARDRDKLQKDGQMLDFVDYDRFCKSFWASAAHGWFEPEGCREYCYSVVDHTLALLESGATFDCMYVLGERCPEDTDPTKKPHPKEPKVDPGRIIDDKDRPILRPGSKVDQLMKELDELIGLQSVKAGMAALRDAVEFDMWRKRFLGKKATLLGQSFHMRFLGNPGTGKTVVARIVGQILVQLGVVQNGNTDNFVFKEVSRPDLIAQYTGQTAPKVIDAVKSAFGGVLFIDEAYSIVLAKDDPFGKEAVDTLIKEIEDNRDKLIVIFAGYQKEMDAFFETNPGFQSRVPFRFEFADYSCQELVGISRYSAKKNDVKPTTRAVDWLQKIISAKTGCCTEEDLEQGKCAGATRDNGNGRAVRNVLESAMRAMSVRVVAENKGTMDAAAELTDIDVAAVGGEEPGPWGGFVVDVCASPCHDDASFCGSETEVWSEVLLPSSRMAAAPPADRRGEAERLGDGAVAEERAPDPVPADPIAQLKAQRAILKKELKDCTKQMRNEARRKRRLLKKAGNLTVEELSWLMVRRTTRAA
ncbi:cfxQ [Symbiodinium sp. CCMP2592]|nr:cfxQ [Symbiodinium sp. CCMP2592]